MLLHGAQLSSPYPPHLLLPSLSLLDLAGLCFLAIFFSPSIHVHHILLLSVIFVSLLFSAICPPPSSSLAEFNPRACCGLLCGASTQSQSPGFGSAVTPSLSFSPLSVLARRVCLSAGAADGSLCCRIYSTFGARACHSS